MYFVLKSLARNLVLPPAGPLLLALLGALLIWRRRRFGWALMAIGLASLWLLSTAVVADALSRLVEHYPALDASRPTDAQAIVILGGGTERRWAPEYAGPAADSLLLERLTYGAFLAKHLSLPVLVTGTPIEADAMRTTLARNFGIETRWIDAQSHDTYENAHFSAGLLRASRIDRIVLVTSSTHLRRAAHEFEAVGLQVVPAPSGMISEREGGIFRFVPGPGALMRSNAAIYELLGEPMRRLQAALGVRERLDRKATVAASADAVPPDSVPAGSGTDNR